MSDLRCPRGGECDEDIFDIVQALVAGQPPPRIDVRLLPDGRLFLLGSPAGGKNADGTPKIVGYHVWYCCVRFGRPTVPVREVPSFTAPIQASREYEAPVESFSCRGNPPAHPGGPEDNHRLTYDEAMARAAA